MSAGAGIDLEGGGSPAGLGRCYVCRSLGMSQLMWVLWWVSHSYPCLKQTSWETGRAVGWGNRYTNLPWVQAILQWKAINTEKLKTGSFWAASENTSLVHCSRFPCPPATLTWAVPGLWFLLLFLSQGAFRGTCNLVKFSGGTCDSGEFSHLQNKHPCFPPGLGIPPSQLYFCLLFICVFFELFEYSYNCSFLDGFISYSHQEPSLWDQLWRKTCYVSVLFLCRGLHIWK